MHGVIRQRHVNVLGRCFGVYRGQDAWSYSSMTCKCTREVFRGLQGTRCMELFVNDM